MNSNLVNMHLVVTEIEGFLNILGTRQNQLITMVEYTNDCCILNMKGKPEKEKPSISIPKFSLTLASFDFDPQNLKAPKSYKRRK